MRKKSKVERIKHTLELDESIELHERGWKIQRVGWYLIFLVMALAALGVFGNGIVSKQRREAGNIEMNYNRFLRFEAETVIKFRSISGSINELALAQDYLRKFKIEKIVPDATAVTTRSEFVLFSYPPGDTHSVVIYLTPKESGSADSRILLNGAETELSQFIYP